MNEAELEPPIIEDLVRYGRERGLDAGRREGLETGRREGLETGTRDGLLTLLAARGLSLTAELRARVDDEHDVARLREWVRRAAVASSVDEVFEG